MSGLRTGLKSDFFSLSNFSKLFNFSDIFVPMPFCQLVRIWSLFLSILLAQKYLQPNFEVQGVSGSLSLGLIPTVLIEGPLEFSPISIHSNLYKYHFHPGV